MSFFYQPFGKRREDKYTSDKGSFAERADADREERRKLREEEYLLRREIMKEEYAKKQQELAAQVEQAKKDATLSDEQRRAEAQKRAEVKAGGGYKNIFEWAGDKFEANSPQDKAKREAAGKQKEYRDNVDSYGSIGERLGDAFFEANSPQDKAKRAKVGLPEDYKESKQVQKEREEKAQNFDLSQEEIDLRRDFYNRLGFDIDKYSKLRDSDYKKVHDAAKKGFWDDTIFGSKENTLKDVDLKALAEKAEKEGLFENNEEAKKELEQARQLEAQGSKSNRNFYAQAIRLATKELGMEEERATIEGQFQTRIKQEENPGNIAEKLGRNTIGGLTETYAQLPSNLQSLGSNALDILSPEGSRLDKYAQERFDDAARDNEGVKQELYDKGIGQLEEDGFWGNLGRGAGSLAAAVVIGPGGSTAVTGKAALAAKGGQAIKNAKELSKAAKLWKGTKAFAKPSVVGTLFGINKGGDIVRESRALGNSATEAGLQSLVAGYAEGVLENFGLSKMFSRFGTGRMAGLVGGAITEGSQEFLQDISTSIVQQTYKDVDWSEAIGQAWQSAVIGGILGGSAGVVTGGAAEGGDLQTELVKAFVEQGMPQEEAVTLAQQYQDKINNKLQEVGETAETVDPNDVSEDPESVVNVRPPEAGPSEVPGANINVPTDVAVSDENDITKLSDEDLNTMLQESVARVAKEDNQRNRDFVNLYSAEIARRAEAAVAVPDEVRTPRAEVPRFNKEIQPETQAGIDDLIKRSDATPIAEGTVRMFQSNSATGKTQWLFDNVDSLLSYKNNTTNKGDTFEFIDVPKSQLQETDRPHTYTIKEAENTKVETPKAPTKGKVKPIKKAAGKKGKYIELTSSTNVEGRYTVGQYGGNKSDKYYVGDFDNKSPSKKYIGEFDTMEEAIAERNRLEKIDKGIKEKTEPTQKERVEEAVKGKPKSIKEVADETGIKEPNIRRILGVGAKEGTFKRVEKGVYVLNVGGQDMAWVEAGDAVESLPRLVKEGFKADMVFLDIPYKTAAVTGGNRGVKYNLLTTDQFQSVVDDLKKIVKDENTPVFHMYSQATSGLKQMGVYNDIFSETFMPVARGEYTKTQLDGVTQVKNMRGAVIKPEGIIVGSLSGKLNFDNPNLNFKLVRPKGYQTEKPAEMLKALIEMSTKEGDVVLDPFAGSGVTGAEAIKLNRKSYNIEVSEEVVENVTKPRIEKAAKEVDNRDPLEILKSNKDLPQIDENTLQERIKQGYTEDFVRANYARPSISETDERLIRSRAKEAGVSEKHIDVLFTAIKYGRPFVKVDIKTLKKLAKNQEISNMFKEKLDRLIAEEPFVNRQYKGPETTESVTKESTVERYDRAIEAAKKAKDKDAVDSLKYSRETALQSGANVSNPSLDKYAPTEQKSGVEELDLTTLYKEDAYTSDKLYALEEKLEEVTEKKDELDDESSSYEELEMQEGTLREEIEQLEGDIDLDTHVTEYRKYVRTNLDAIMEKDVNALMEVGKLRNEAEKSVNGTELEGELEDIAASKLVDELQEENPNYGIDDYIRETNDLTVEREVGDDLGRVRTTPEGASYMMGEEADTEAKFKQRAQLPRREVQRDTLEEKPLTKKEAQELQGLNEGIQMLSEAFEVPIRRGRMRMRKALGEHHTKDEIIRLRKIIGEGSTEGGRFGVAVHEVGHNMSKNMPEFKIVKGQGIIMLGKEGNKDLSSISSQPGTGGSVYSEGFSEFMRYYVVNPEGLQTKMPETYKKIDTVLQEEYPGFYTALMRARNQWHSYQKAPATKKIMSQISYEQKKDSIRDRITKGIANIYTNWWNDIYPMEQLEKSVQKGGTKIAEVDKPSTLAFLYRGWYGKARTFLEYGTISNDPYVMNEKTQQWELETNGKGFKEITHPIYSQGQEAEFDAYLVAKRMISVKEQKGYTTGVAIQDAKDAVAELEQKYPAFVETQKELSEYQDRLIKYLVEAGTVSADGAATFKKLNENYVPFYRVFEAAGAKGAFGKGYADLSSGIKKMKGSEADIVSPLESIVKNTMVLIQAAEANKVGLAFADMAKDSKQAAQMFEKVKTPQAPVATITLAELGIVSAEKSVASFQGMQITDEADINEAMTIFRPMYQDKSERIVTVLRNGQREFYYVADQSLYAAITMMNKEQANAALKLLSYPASWLRAGATLTPEFVARNPFRDQFSATVNSVTDYLPFIDAVKGGKKVIKKDKNFWLWQASGAPYATLVSVDRNYDQIELDRVTNGTFKNRYKNPNQRKALIKEKLNFIKYLRDASELTENATRMGEFSEAISTHRNFGIKRRAMHPMEAAMASKEVTLNFSRAGLYGRTVNLVSAFFNAAAQDIDKNVRMMKNRPVNYFTKGTIFITLPTILLYLANRDEEWYKEMPTWRKDFTWSFKIGDGPIISVPKPFFLGTLFGTIPERILGEIDNRGARDLGGFGELVISSTIDPIGSVIPTALKPVIETITNFNFFTGRPIDPASEENLPNDQKYGPWTSEVAKIISQVTGSVISPRMVDNILGGYFGGLGDYAVSSIDKALELSGREDPYGNPEAPDPFTDIMFIKAFVARSPYGSGSESVNDLYEANARAIGARDAASKLDDVIGKEAGDKYREEHPEYAFASTYTKFIGDLSDIRKEIDYIRKDKNKDSIQKRTEIDELEKRMTYIAQEALRFDPYNENSKTPIPSETITRERIYNAAKDNISEARRLANEHNEQIKQYLEDMGDYYTEEQKKKIYEDRKISTSSQSIKNWREKAAGLE